MTFEQIYFRRIALEIAIGANLPFPFEVKAEWAREIEELNAIEERMLAA